MMTDKHRLYAVYALIVATIAVVLGMTAYDLGRGAGLEVAAEAGKREQVAVDKASMLTDERAGLLMRQDQLHSRITTMQAEIESLTAAVTAVTLDNQALKERLRQAEARRATPAPTPRALPQSNSRPSGPGQVSAEWIRTIAKDEATRRGFSAADKQWVADAAVRVAWRESTNRPNARNGSHLGLMQFNSRWAGNERLCPEWSIRRFIRVMDEAGRDGIRRHWRATIGG